MRVGGRRWCRGTRGAAYEGVLLPLFWWVDRDEPEGARGARRGDSLRRVDVRRLWACGGRREQAGRGEGGESRVGAEGWVGLAVVVSNEEADEYEAGEPYYYSSDDARIARG